MAAAPRTATIADLVRITEEASNLLEKVEAVCTAVADGADPASARIALEARFTSVRADIDACFSQIWAQSPATSETAFDLSVRTADLQNAWRDVLTVWDSWDGDQKKLGDQAKRLRDVLRQMLSIGLSLSMPFRVNEALAAVPVGECLHYLKAFKSAAPADTLAASFAELGERPTGIHGLLVADVTDPRIFKVHPRLRVRLLTWAAPLVAFAVGYGLVWLAQWLDILSALHKDLSAADAAKALTLAYVGAVLHLLVTSLKETRRAATGTETPDVIGQWLLWLHVKYSAYTMAVLYVIIAAALAMKSVPAGQSPASLWLLFITAGYSADSLVDTFLTKVPTFFEGRAASIKL